MKKYRVKKGITIIVCLMLFAVAVTSGCGERKDDRPEDVRDKKTDAAKYVFPAIPGWNQPEVKTYLGEELYDPINGEADRFVAQGFVKAHFAIYTGDDPDAEIDVRLYDMGNPENAFGIFSLYDGKEFRRDILPSVIAVSSGSDRVLQFARGRYFCNITLFGMEPDADLLAKAGKHIAESIAESPAVPSLVSMLPEGYTSGTVRWFRRWETYRELNYSFPENLLNFTDKTEAVQAEYEQDEQNILTLLMVKYPDEETAQGTFDSFTGFFIDDEAGDEVPAEGYFVASYAGTLIGRFGLCYEYIVGVTGMTEEELAEELLGKADNVIMEQHGR